MSQPFSNFKKNYNNLVKQYRGIVFSHAMIDKFFGATYIAAMVAAGLSATQIGFILTITSLCLTIFDYPSGNIADVVGRRKTLAIGFVVWGVSFLLYAASSGFLQFTFSMVLWALGAALISGTPVAWFVDEANLLDAHEEIKFTLPAISSSALIFGALTAAMASYFISLSLTLPLILAGLTAIVTSGLVLRLKENYGDKNKTILQSVKLNTKLVIESTNLKLIVLFKMLSRVPFQIFVVGWQLYALNLVGLPVEYLGFMLGILILFVALGNAASALIIKHIPAILVSFLGMICIALAASILVFGGNIASFVIGALFFEFGLGLAQGASSVWVHDFIQSKQRASLVSLFSAAGSMVGLVIPVSVGIIIDFIGYKAIWGLAIVFSCISAFILLRLFWSSQYK